MPIYKEVIEKRLQNWLEKNTKYKFAAMLIPSATFGFRSFEDAVLLSIVDGSDGWGSDPGWISFPNELVEEYGGEEAQYGYIEFECDVPPGDDWIDRIPFDEAFKLFEVASKHYIEYRPERREMVEAKMREGRKTFDGMIARHEAWKKTNGVS